METYHDGQGLDRTVLVANQKGGVGKSSLVAGLSTMIAAPGRRVLVIDADPQGNVGRLDLGEEGDAGKGLGLTLQYDLALQPLRDVRPGLDLVPGGPLLAGVPAAAAAAGTDLAANLRGRLAELQREQGYALVLIDSGPGDTVILDALLRVVRWLVVPTADDAASMEGVALLARRYLRARGAGSDVELLGTVLFGVNPRAAARNRTVHADIDQLLEGSGAGRFDTVVRADKAAAIDLRANALTPRELAAAAVGEKKARIGALRDGGPVPRRLWSRDPAGLAGDYQDLARELVARLAERGAGR